MNARLVFLGFLLVLLSACAAESGDPAENTGAVSQAIVDGDRDSHDASVVALLVHGEVYCTGVLVEPSLVVTAAHCVDPAPDQVYFGADPKSKKGELIEVTHARAHPDFDPEKLVNDIAVVALGKKATAKPSKINKASLEAGDVGREIRLVGFGVTSAEDVASAGKKRVGTSTIGTVKDEEFIFQNGNSTTCVGDSGGPAFAQNDKGDDVVIGIASSGDAACKEYGRHIRVDAYIDFINDNAEAYSLGIGDNVENAGCSQTAPRARPSLAPLAFLVLAVVRKRRRREAPDYRCSTNAS